LYESFLKACVEKTKKLRVGNGRDRETDVGPMIHERQLRIVQSHVDDAVARGARVLAGGSRFPELGQNFYKPTVLADLTHEMRIMREETFGPVLPVAALAASAWRGASRPVPSWSTMWFPVSASAKRRTAE
jgi:succinate-semialdehyde dehydrogenase/glutarate-semialdehyde dehydrogenase